MTDTNGFQDHHETARIEAMEKHAAPMHWLLLVIVLAVGFFMVDEWKESVEDKAAIAKLLDECARGNAVQYDGAIMWCSVRRLIGE